VNAYYSQFETDSAEQSREAEPAAAGEEPAEGGEAETGAPEVAPGVAPAAEGAVPAAEAPSEAEIPAEIPEPADPETANREIGVPRDAEPEPAAAKEETVEQSGTMEGAGSPTHNHFEGTGAPEEGRGE